MRGVLSLVGLLLAVVVVAGLVRKQLKTPMLSVPTAVTQDAAGAPGIAVSASGNAATQSQQVQQQVKQAMEQAMQPRVLPDDKP